MPNTDLLLAFLVTALILNLSPGPSNLYVLARSLSQGARGGVVAALGLATGCMVHVMAAAFGLSAIFLHSPMLYTGIKLLGAVYLIYLGITYWRAATKGEALAVARNPERPLSQIYRESIVVEITNPKTALFFVALLPQFVSPEAGPVPLQLFLLGLIVILSALPCDLVIAFAASRVSGWLAGHTGFVKTQEKVSGTILGGLGLFIAGEEVLDIRG